MLGHVHVAVRRRIDDAMWAVGHGGPLSLLPLTLPAVDPRSLQPLQAPPGSGKRGAAISASAYQQQPEQLASSREGVQSLGVLSSSLAPAVLRVMAASLRRQMNVEELKGSSPCMLAYWLGHCLAFPERGARGAGELGGERGENGADSSNFRGDGGADTSSAHDGGGTASAAPAGHPASGAPPGAASVRNLDLVSAVVGLCSAPQHADALKTHLLSHLLLDLPLWAPCGLALMRTLLGGVARLVPSEYHNMRAAGAVPVRESGSG